MKLGRLPHDPVALAALPAHRFGAQLAPPVVDRSAVEVEPGLFDNDNFRDCTCVAMTNLARGVAALNGFGLVVDPDKPLALYANVLGNPPDLAATDGAVALDVIMYQASHGFDIGPQRLVANHGPVALNRNSLALSIDRLGGGYWGVTLYERDMDTVGSIWDVEYGRDDGKIVGGHMINGWDYTGLSLTDKVRVGTWGRWQPATWAWVNARLEEAHGLVWRQLAKADGTFYSGLTADGLVAEI